MFFLMGQVPCKQTLGLKLPLGGKSPVTYPKMILVYYSLGFQLGCDSG